MQGNKQLQKKYNILAAALGIWLIVALAAIGIMCLIYPPGKLPEYLGVMIQLGLIGAGCLFLCCCWPGIIDRIDQGGSL